MTGQPYADVLEERILDPYGLADTVLDDGTALITQHGWWGPGAGDPDLGTFDPTVPRDIDSLDWPTTALQTFDGAASAMVSTTTDLLDWAEVLYGGQFLGDEMNAELRTLPITDRWAGGDRRYGLGVTGFCPCDDSTDPPGVTVLGHAGTHPSPIATTATVFGHDTATGISVASRSNVGEIALLDRDDLITAALALIDGS